MSERQRQDELDVKSLRILRAIVHNEIVQIDPQLKEDDPTGYRRRCTNKVQPVQNKIQSFGNVMSRVSPLPRVWGTGQVWWSHSVGCTTAVSS